MSEFLGNPAEHWPDRLERDLGASWPAIRKARITTQQKRRELENAFNEQIVADSSLVVFGSIAREEWTSGSDLDWILLVDGQAIPQHDDQRRTISTELNRLKFAKPGRSGIFGCMAGSHDIVHQIGGEDDTNSNTTRRVLLLLESFPVGNRGAREAYIRVRRQILNRYLVDDRGLLHGGGPVRVPRFLLNDLTRYWRTVTVDFVYKQRAESGEKWALRNAKLRMSRKLVFASGLLRCFFCHLDEDAADARQALQPPNKDVTKLLAYMEKALAQTPLELLARAVCRPAVERRTARKLFDSYDRFLDTLDNPEKRGTLERMSEAEMQDSPVWQSVRDLSRDFHSSLIDLFFGRDEELHRLSTHYGVF